MSVLAMPLSDLFIAPARRRNLKACTAMASDINRLARRILKDGLLNPLTVKRLGSKFIVVDGAKRLRALQILSKAGRLPRSLTRIPVDVSNGAMACENTIAEKPALLSDAELCVAITAAHKSGQSEGAIAQRYDCREAIIGYALSLTRLNPQIRDYFESGHLSLEQAAAFASVENPDAQWRLLQELGPFAHAKDVIAAILEGRSVIELADGNVMILPSRRAEAQKPTFSRPKFAA